MQLDLWLRNLQNFRETLNEQRKDPEFKAEWDALEPEFQIMKGVFFERTQKFYGKPLMIWKMEPINWM